MYCIKNIKYEFCGILNPKKNITELENNYVNHFLKDDRLEYIELTNKKVLTSKVKSEKFGYFLTLIIKNDICEIQQYFREEESKNNILKYIINKIEE